MGQKTPNRTGPTTRRTRTEANPWPRRLGIGGVGIAIVLLAGVVLFNSPPPRGVPEGTESVQVGAPAHVEGDIHGDGEVPAGGPHSAVWQNCGFYDIEIRSENAVHSLEHGAVWITFRPGVSTDQLSRLRGFTGRDEKVLVSPVHGQAAPIMATAWANQLEVESADDPRLEQFVNEFKRGLGAPEPGGACTGGIG